MWVSVLHLKRKKNEWKIKKQLQRVMNILACLKALNKCWWKWNTFSREMDWNCCYVFLLIYICVYDAHIILVLKNKNKHKQFVFYAVNFSFFNFLHNSCNFNLTAYFQNLSLFQIQFWIYIPWRFIIFSHYI